MMQQTPIPRAIEYARQMISPVDRPDLIQSEEAAASNGIELP